MLPPCVFRHYPQSESVQSLVLKRGLSLACTDCAPCGGYRGRVKVPGLRLCTFPWLLCARSVRRLHVPGPSQDSATDRHL